MSKFKPGDIVTVTETHNSGSYVIREGTQWELISYVPEEVEDGVSYPASWEVAALDGSAYGQLLEADKAERMTENIPFTIWAEVLVEVVSTVYASSEEEAVAKAKSDYYQLLHGNNTEMSGTVRRAHRADF